MQRAKVGRWREAAARTISVAQQEPRTRINGEGSVVWCSIRKRCRSAAARCRAVPGVRPVDAKARARGMGKAAQRVGTKPRSGIVTRSNSKGTIAG